MKMSKLARNQIYLLFWLQGQSSSSVSPQRLATGRKYSTSLPTITLKCLWHFTKSAAIPTFLPALILGCLALSKNISNTFIVAYRCAGMSLALNKVIKNPYIASCLDRRMSLLALDGIISNSYTVCSKSTSTFHNDDVETINHRGIQCFTP